MNNIRRKSLRNLMGRIEDIRAELEELQSQEEEYRDNMPDNLWGSERFEKANEACDNMYSALDSLEEAFEYIKEATN